MIGCVQKCADFFQLALSFEQRQSKFILDFSVSLTTSFHHSYMALQENKISSTNFIQTKKMGKYSSLVEQIIDEYGDGISPEDLLVILDSMYDVVNIEQIDDELYGLQMQNIVKYNAQENLYKYERDEINLLLGIGGGEIKLINPDQFMERHGY